MPLHLTSEVACENRGTSLPTMENFSFPKAFPLPSNRPLRTSEEVSPKHLPQTIAPHLLASGGCPPAKTPPLSTVTLDQISCLDVKGPLNPTTISMGMGGFDFAGPPIQLTDRPLSQPGYMQLNPHAGMPFAMYSMGNLVPLPPLSHTAPCANTPGTEGTTGTVGEPNRHHHGQQTSVETTGKPNGQQTGDSGDVKFTSATEVAQSSLGPAPTAPGLQQTAPQKSPCLICARARQNACHGQGQQQAMVQDLAHGAHLHGPVPPLTSIWNPFPPQFGNFGQYSPTAASALVSSPLTKVNPMSTWNPASGQIHHTPPSSRAATPGIVGNFAGYVMPTQGNPHLGLIGRPPATHPSSQSSGGSPRPPVGPSMPTSNPSSSRSRTPAPISTSPVTPPPSAAAAADKAPQKQLSLAPPLPTTLSKRKHAQNLLVDVAETVEEIFPFEEVARRHGVLQRKVVEALAAVVQVPLLRCATDKRRPGKLGSERMKEYREARKAWITKETEAGKFAKGTVISPAGGSGRGPREDAGKDGQEKDGREIAASAPTAMQLVDMLPPTDLPSTLTNDAVTGPW